jgi:hypothetical protein
MFATMIVMFHERVRAMSALQSGDSYKENYIIKLNDPKRIPRTINGMSTNSCHHGRKWNLAVIKIQGLEHDQTS